MMQEVRRIETNNVDNFLFWEDKRFLGIFFLQITKSWNLALKHLALTE